MSTQSDDRTVEHLLEQAPPRPVPSEEAAQRAKLAVREEWQQTIGRRRNTRRLQVFAAAAALVLAISVLMTTVLAPVPVQVATVEKASGAIYFLGARSELERAAGLSAIMSGQTIVTGDDTVVGLGWGGGGSLRLDANTEIAFMSKERVELESGTVYFDSLSESAASVLTIGTPHGEVRHVGTQYLTSASEEELVVRVREGRVEIEGHFYNESAQAGEAIRIRGSEPPHKTNTAIYGASWEWTEAAAPAISMEGLTLREFLAWVERETGLEILFEDSTVEADVIDYTMAGEVSEAPRVALRQRLRTYGLRFEEIDGRIFIRR